MRLLPAVLGCLVALPASADGPAPDAVKAAMGRATAYFRGTIACHGGYLWEYSEDLTQREGEGPATASQVWVQYPGTPAVGEVYLRAHEVTGDAEYLKAAIEVGEALAWGQLASGGWDYKLDFDATESQRWYTRRDVEAGDKEPGKRRNVTTLDDNTTQGALRYLMRLDQRLEQRNEALHGAVKYALEALLAAQYPNGAWPQRFSAPPDPATPVVKAHYPESWSRTYPKLNYSSYYTFNDNTLRDTIATMFLAAEIYGDRRFEASALKAADFILLAQMPEPQPVWAQQYNHQMEPAWARRFEPPSVTGGESVGVMQMLFDLWLKTGDTRYRDALRPACRWFRESRLPDGDWARFYELHTNRPLYFVKDTYELTYDSSNMPTHYSFKSKYGTAVLDRIEPALDKPREELLAQRQRVPTPADWARRAATAAKPAGEFMASLDDRGRWVEKGRIRVQTFNSRMLQMCSYLEALQKAGQ